MVDSIKQSMNRIDVQRAHVNNTDTKLGTKSSDVSKGSALDGANIDTSKLEVSVIYYSLWVNKMIKLFVLN